ncbi:PREDICTED: tripartite motif-containing protein 5-like, partial [Galeopterus variegatus]|uniref:Tripartite motif-containing protein 5-like n=1 Tax=Galeopterus variegatus TaxID=482537 RepID=A0ABM0SFU0_GALVR
MASAFLENLKEEVTRPICLELLTEPVSLDCGHSFCQACITTNQKKSTVVQEGEGSCPVCRISDQIENLRPSRHLAKIVERVREVKLSPEEGQKVDHCAQHGEKLVLFCKKESKIICWLCEQCQEHLGHNMLLVEEVAQEYQEKIQAALEKLKKQQQEAEQLQTDVQEERTSWKPVSLDCGHNFCQACITANQKMSTVVQEGEGSCPVCLIRYQIENLRPSRYLANIVEMLREAKLSPEEGQKVDHCVCHGEKLRLFCKEDGKIICWLCERSPEHRGHHTFLTEEVVQEYQEKLQAALEKLKQQQQEAEKLEADIQAERTSWKNLIQYERETVQSEFEKLRAILDCEEQNQLQKLEKEERGILKILAESEIELAQQSQVVRDLISDVEHRLQGTAMEMLQ